VTGKQSRSAGAAPVWYVYDGDLNIYWWSPVEAQHSRNISTNTNVYITVFDSTLPEGEGKGLYLRAEAKEIEDDKLDSVIELYNETTEIFKLDRENCTNNAPTRLYRAITREGWTNDGLTKDGFYVDQRISL
jgi:uncharacterized protein YhbP (UPF0306 family)